MRALSLALAATTLSLAASLAPVAASATELKPKNEEFWQTVRLAILTNSEPITFFALICRRHNTKS